MSGLGLSGFDRANEILDNDIGIVSELVRTKSVTLALGLGTTREHVERLVSGLKHLSDTFPVANCETENVDDLGERAPFDDSVVILNPREAFFASKTAKKLEECTGEVCGEFVCPHPPAVPVLIPGELITEKALRYLHRIKSQGGLVIGPADSLLHTIVVCKNSQ